MFDWLRYRTLHPVDKELRKTLRVYTEVNLDLLEHFLGRATRHAERMDTGDSILPAEEILYNECVARANMRLNKLRELKRLKRYLDR